MQADVLLKMADMALYRAKAEGRSTARFFRPEMDQELQARRTLKLDLCRAIAMQEFELHYQPLVDVPSGSVIAFKALVRWRHPARGLVRPDAFITLAEDTGLIVQIGNWVLQQACMDAAGWPASVRVAVNLSAAEFRVVGLVEAVAKTLEDAKLAPDRLELEITETALITDTETTLTVIQALRRTGIRIVLDNFGTGYSSLDHLRQFPFDKIKIDRSFVQDIKTRADCEAIVRAVTDIVSNLWVSPPRPKEWRRSYNSSSCGRMAATRCKVTCSAAPFQRKRCCPCLRPSRSYRHPQSGIGRSDQQSPKPPSGLPKTGWEHSGSSQRLLRV